MHKLLSTTLVAGLALLPAGCIFHVDSSGATSSWQRDGDPAQVRRRNRASLQDLEIGMTRREVERIMGVEAVWAGSSIGWIDNPYRTEAFRAVDGKPVLVLFYYTHLTKRDDIVENDELTPVALVDDRLVGWGWSYFRRNIDRF